MYKYENLRSIYPKYYYFYNYYFFTPVAVCVLEKKIVFLIISFTLFSHCLLVIFNYTASKTGKLLKSAGIKEFKKEKINSDRGGRTSFKV